MDNEAMPHRRRQRRTRQGGRQTIGNNGTQSLRLRRVSRPHGSPAARYVRSVARQISGNAETQNQRLKGRANGPMLVRLPDSFASATCKERKKKMKTLKKVLSVGLSLVMCASMVAPAMAASFTDFQNAIDGGDGADLGNGRFGYGYNAETEKYGIEAWTTKDEENNETRNVQLNEDVKQTEEEKENNTNIVINSGKDITLDLNGHNVTGSYDGMYLKGMVEVTDSTSLTVKNTTDGEESGGEGKIVNNGSANSLYVSGKDSQATLESGTIETDTGVKSVMVNDHGAFTMNGGTVSGGAQNTITVMGEGSSANLNDGTVKREKAEGLEDSDAVTAQQNGKIVVDGAEIIGESKAGIHVNNGASAEIKSGKITGAFGGVTASNGASLDLTGGTVTSKSQPVDGHADIEIANTALGDSANTVHIGPGVKFETLAILGQTNGEGGQNSITVDGKYQVSYGSDHTVKIESQDEDNPNAPALYDVAKGQVIKDGQNKGWETIFLGPNAITDPWNQIPDTQMGYGFKSETDGKELPENFFEEHGDAKKGTEIKVEGGKWVFNGWPDSVTGDWKNVDDEEVENMPVFDDEGNFIYTTNTPVFDKDGKHVDLISVIGGWTFVADPKPVTPPTRPTNPGTVIPDNDVPMGELPEEEIEDEAVPLAGLFTRADAIGYLWEKSGSPEWELSDFEDVPEDHHWAVAIGWAQDMGIALADEDGNFRPDDLVLRSVESLEISPEGELQEFLNRYAVYAGIELDDGELFIELDGSWAEVIMGEEAQEIFDDFFARLELALEQAA